MKRSLYKLMTNAGYSIGDARKINKMFKIFGITTVEELQDSPKRLGNRIQGHDLYDVISAVVQAANTPDPPAQVEKETDNGEDN